MDPIESEMARRGLAVGGAATPTVPSGSQDVEDPVEAEMRRRGLQGGPSFEKEATAVLSGANSTIANMAGFPVDAMTWLLNQVGAGIENPIGGSQSIKSGMNALGIATDQEPETALGRIGKRVASEVAAVPMMMMGAGAVGPALTAAQASTRPFLGPAIRAVGTAGAPVAEALGAAPGMQVATGIGAGIGGGVAREAFPDSPTADVVGSLAGGLATAAVPAAAQWGAGVVRSVIDPFREEGRKAVVGRTLERLSADQGLKGSLDDALAHGDGQIIPGSKPTTAQLLHDDGLAAAERSLRSDPQVAGRFSTRAAEQSAARKSYLDTGVPDTHGGATALAGKVGDRVSQFRDFADDMVASAEDEVRRRVGGMGGTIDAETAGRQIREAIQARRDALATVRDRVTRPLYDAARDEAATVDPSQSLALIQDALKVAKGEVAAPLERARNDFFVRGTQRLDTTSAGLMGTRQSISAMLIDPAVPAHSKSILRDARDLLDEAIEAASPTFREANRQYRELSAPITRIDERLSGDVLRENPLLVRAGQPAYETPASAVPGKFIRRGAGGPEAARELAETTAKSPEAARATSDYLVTSLRDFATREDGTINPQRWQKWLSDNRAALDLDPALKQRVRSARDAQAVLDSIAGRRERTLAEVQKGALGYLLKQDPDAAIGSMLDSKSGAQEVERVLRLIGRDQDAKAALRRSIVEHLWKKSTTTATDSLDNPVISTAMFQRFLNTHEPELAAAFRSDPNGLYYIKRVAEDMQRSSWSNTGGRVAGSNTMQNMTTANIMGAVFRGVLNPTSASLPNATIGRFVSWLYRIPETKMQEMLVEAMLDPKIARVMLEPAVPQNVERITRLFLERGIATTARTATQDRQEAPAEPTSPSLQ